MNCQDDQYIAEFLEEKYVQYNTKGFISTDPILIPHQYNMQEDIEIAAFLTAIMAWGSRSQIIKKTQELLVLMDHQPYDFVMEAAHRELKTIRRFQYRTFLGPDVEFFLMSLQNLYRHHGGLRESFEEGYKRSGSLYETLIQFRKLFFSFPGPLRTRKHIADVMKGSAAKRLNMLLRWMVRKDRNGVDFGIWPGIPASALMIPLDVHTGTVARKLGLLTRKQDDWKAVEELTARLREFDPNDPVKYDYALFGLGIFEKF